MEIGFIFSCVDVDNLFFFCIFIVCSKKYMLDDMKVVFE